MKKFILTLIIGLLATSVQAGVLTNNGKVEWGTDYYAIDLSIVERVEFKVLSNGKGRLNVITHIVGGSVPEFQKWVYYHDRTSITETATGTPAELVDGKLRLYTTWIFQDNLPGAEGSFMLRREVPFGIASDFPNTNNIIHAIGRTTVEYVRSRNVPYIGTSKWFTTFNGNAKLYLYVDFPVDKMAEFNVLAEAVNAAR